MKSLEEHQGYLEAKQRLQAIGAELAEVRRKISTVVTELSQLPAGTVRIRNEAAALISGGGPADLDRAADAVRDELGELYHRAEVLAEAEAMQRRIVTAEREKASREICKAAGPEWRKRAGRIATLCRELAEAGKADSDFREDLRRSGVFLSEPLSDATAMTENLLWKLSHTADEIETALSVRA